jgi:hypothetical protein
MIQEQIQPPDLRGLLGGLQRRKTARKMDSM